MASRIGCGLRRVMAGMLVAGALAAGVVRPPAVTGQPACSPTRADELGPFYKANAPERSTTGQGLVLHGTVRSVRECAPLAGARLEWWSADRAGRYGDEHRATQRTDPAGRYRYQTDVPGRYPGRPPHLHLLVSAPGHRTLITQIYPNPGQTEIEADLVLARE